MNAAHIIFLKLMVGVLIGVPLAYLIDREGWLFFYTRMVGETYLEESYLWSLYAISAMIVCYYVFGISRALQKYQQKPTIAIRRKTAFRYWLFSIGFSMLTFFYVYAANGYSHPVISALSMNYAELARLRIAIRSNVNLNLYNIGLQIFSVLSIILSAISLKSLPLTLLSGSVFLLLATFSLEKSMVAECLIILLVFLSTFKKIALRDFVNLALLAVVLTTGMFVLTKSGDTPREIASGFLSRTAYGQVAALPLHFSHFENNRSNFLGLLPPYVQDLSGDVQPTPGRLIMQEYVNPLGVDEETVGVASTFFIGDAYAVFGTPGVIAAPFIAMLNFAMVVHLFSRLRKGILNLFVFSVAVFKLQFGLFGSISTFIFSSVHILILMYIIFMFCEQRYSEAGVRA